MKFKFKFNTLLKCVAGKKRNSQSYNSENVMEVDIPVLNIKKVLCHKNNRFENTYYYDFENEQFYNYCMDIHYGQKKEYFDVKINFENNEIISGVSIDPQSSDFETIDEKEIKTIIFDKRNEREIFIKKFFSNYVICDGLVLRKCSMPIFMKNTDFNDYYVLSDEKSKTNDFDKINFNTNTIVDVSDMPVIIDDFKKQGKCKSYEFELLDDSCFVNMEKLFVLNETRFLISELTSREILLFSDKTFAGFKKLCNFLFDIEKEIGIYEEKYLCGKINVYDYKKFLSYDYNLFKKLFLNFYNEFKNDKIIIDGLDKIFDYMKKDINNDPYSRKSPPENVLKI